MATTWRLERYVNESQLDGDLCSFYSEKRTLGTAHSTSPVTYTIPSEQPTASRYEYTTGQSFATRYAFTSWNSKADGSGTSYRPGQTITLSDTAGDHQAGNGTFYLYAQWEPLPRIDGLECFRCDAAGNEDPYGSYLRVRADLSASESGRTLTDWCVLYIAERGNSTWEKYDSGLVYFEGHPEQYAFDEVLPVGLDVSYPSGTVVFQLTDETDLMGTATLEEHDAVGYYPPVISDVETYRCDAAGAMDDEGTCVKVLFDWRVWEPPVQALTVSTEVEERSVAIDADATAGRQSVVLAGPYDVNRSYEAAIALSDRANTTTVRDQVTTAFFTMDFLGASQGSPTSTGGWSGPRPGHGIAFGKPSTREGFDVAMDTDFSARLDHDGNPVGYVKSGKMQYMGTSESVWCPFPVGSIFMTVDATAPSTYYPGTTWERIAAGTFLAASSGTTAGDYRTGNTGGAASVTLTSAQSGNQAQTVTSGGMSGNESHNHGPGSLTKFLTTNAANVAVNGTARNFPSTGGSHYMVYATTAASIEEPTTTGSRSIPHTHSVTVAAKDATSAHENRPPFLAVNMWKRTA